MLTSNPAGTRKSTLGRRQNEGRPGSRKEKGYSEVERTSTKRGRDLGASLALIKGGLPPLTPEKGPWGARVSYPNLPNSKMTDVPAFNPR